MAESLYEKVLAKVLASGQDQLANHIRSSRESGENVDNLLQQLDGIDINQTVERFRVASGLSALVDGVQPVPLYNLSNDEATQAQALLLGEEAIRNGKVGAVILSGGQGTRLGFSGPKGMYDLGLVSAKTIFQLHIEKILGLVALYSPRCYPTIYIMTSDLNDGIIREYFQSNDYFGYPQDNVFFFEQGLQPCLSSDYKLLLENHSKLSMAPDGNGGIYLALSKSGAIDDMVHRGIEHLHVYGIDNVLTKSLDPIFIGLCIHKNVELGNKVVWRASKDEKVGVTISDLKGRMHILEYSEIPTHLAEAFDVNTGKLLLGAANICNHYYHVDFIRNKIVTNLSDGYHIAKKKIPYYNINTKQVVAPTANNGMKLEMFIFDVFPLADRWLVMEVERDDEFAPVKNEPGNKSDSPDTARYLMTQLHKRWLSKHNVTFVTKGDITPHAGTNLMTKDGPQCEISSRVSYNGENLESFRDETIVLPTYIDGTKKL